MFWANTKTHSKDSYFHCCAVNGMQTFERFHFSASFGNFAAWKINGNVINQPHGTREQQQSEINEH